MSTAEHEQIIKDLSLGAPDEIYNVLVTMSDHQDAYEEIIRIVAEDILKR